jgi:hypothetical protein
MKDPSPRRNPNVKTFKNDRVTDEESLDEDEYA